jgi:hypothetical protein
MESFEGRKAVFELAAGDARMADNCHDEFATTSVKRSLEPCPLSRIERAQYAGIDRQQCKIVRLLPSRDRRARAP